MQQQTSLQEPQSCALLRCCQRLEGAHGVLVKPHFTCCLTCASAEIDFHRPHGSSKGFVLWHHQDTHLAANGGDLYLAYGPFGRVPSGAQARNPFAALSGVPVHPPPPPPQLSEREREERQAKQLEIARLIMQVLKEEGLHASWDGRACTRIAVSLDAHSRTYVSTLLPPVADDGSDADELLALQEDWLQGGGEDAEDGDDVMFDDDDMGGDGDDDDMMMAIDAGDMSGAFMRSVKGGAPAA